MGGDRAETRGYKAKSPNRFADLELLAARQRQLVTVEQARRAGVPAASLRSRAAAGRLHRIHRGVYSFAPPPFGRRQLWLAAVLACGPGALLSDLPAAALFAIAEPSGSRPHVTVPADRGRRRPGISAHRRVVEPADRFVRDGIPCTSQARTIVDLASSLPAAALERILIRADSLRILNRRRLDELCRKRAGRPGMAVLGALLAPEPARVRSEAEARFLTLCRRAGIAAPAVNRRIEAAGRTFEADFAWPARRIVVEIDGYGFHGGRSRANGDRDREQLLAIAGWRVHRFTADQVRGCPGETVRRLRLLLGTGSGG